MTENIITFHLTVNGPRSNSFDNLNLLESIYPVKSYTKAYICVESFMAAIVEELPYIVITTTGLLNTYEYTEAVNKKVCAPSTILDVISSVNLNSLFEYKSYSDKWKEINVSNLNNFNITFKKDSIILFGVIYLTLKIKLIE